MQEGKLLRLANQPVWRDPQRTISAATFLRAPICPSTLFRLNCLRAAMFRCPSYALARQLIWLQSGELVFQEGDTRHEMHAGDCLELGPPNDCRFINETKKPASIWLYGLISLPRNANAITPIVSQAVMTFVPEGDPDESTCFAKSPLGAGLSSTGRAGRGKFPSGNAACSDPAAGQLLLRTVWLSLDPYMRGRMSDAPSYSPPVELGAVMVGERSAALSSQTIPTSKPVSGCWATAAGRNMNSRTAAAW
jgi:hypothetical protein